MTSSPAATADTATHGSRHSNTPEYLFGGGSPRTTTLDEERREVFDSVLQAVRSPNSDAGRVAACAYLLRHLALTGRR
jgi:hypothetical protein